MQKTWFKIIDNKKNPIYWPAVAALWVLSLFYRIGYIVNSLFVKITTTTKAPVVSVGNLTLGGTGKTPTVKILAEYYLEEGKKVGVASSGYGRLSKGEYFGTGEQLQKKSAKEIGDEILMMAHLFGTAYYGVADQKRDAAMMLDSNFSPDIILVDDGYQHRRLDRKFNLLLIDATVDLRHEGLFPLGRRREPIAAVNRADAILITKVNMTDSSEYIEWIKKRFKDYPVAEVAFKNSAVMDGGNTLEIESIGNAPVYFFAGIGGVSLFEYIKDKFQNVVHIRKFRDHCCYPPDDLGKLMDDIRKYEPEYVITTYKDYVKLVGFDFGRTIYYLDLKLEFISGQEELFEAIDKAVTG